MLAAAILATTTPATAQNATWGQPAGAAATVAGPAPGTFDFNAAQNWSTGSVPTGTAFFGASPTPNISFFSNATFGGWTFNPGAPAYTFTNDQYLIFQGAGIAVNGGSVSITNNIGIIEFYNVSSAGSASFTNNQGVIGFFDNSSAGTATFVNSGLLDFRVDSTAGNATIINNDRVQFVDNANAGSAQLINNSGSADFSLSGFNSGQLTIGSIAGAGDIYLGGNQLSVGSNNLNTTVSGIISDCGPTGTECNNTGAFGGTLVKEGTGTLTLSGINTYTGGTLVNSGTLLVNGATDPNAPVFVNAGGTLGGTGSVGGVFLADSATLAPGLPNAIGTLTANFGVLFCACSIYSVKIFDAAADRTQVNGVALLDGAVVVKPMSVITRTTTYTILTASNTMTGTFSSVSIEGPRASNARLSYDAFTNEVLLTVDAGQLSPFLPKGANDNQRSVAAAIDKALPGAPQLPEGFEALFNLTGGQLLNALTQISGESSSGNVQSALDASGYFLNALFNPSNRGFGAGGSGATPFAAEDDAANAYAAKTNRSRGQREAYKAVTPVMRDPSYDPRWSVWGTGYGGSSTISGNTTTGSNDVTSRAYGFLAGADYYLSRDTLIGFALGGGSTSFGLSKGLGGGNSDLFQAGLFARHNIGATYLSGALSYTFQDVTNNRTVTIAGNDRLRATFDANTFAGRIETGYRFATPLIGVAPYTALQVTHIDLPGYTETAVSGTNTFALSYGAQDTTVTRTELGARFDHALSLNAALLTLNGRAAWAHDEGNTRNVSAIFQTLPGSAFIVNGATPARNAALVSAGAELKWTNNISLAGSFEGEFSDTTQSYGGKGTLRYAW